MNAIPHQTPHPESAAAAAAAALAARGADVTITELHEPDGIREACRLLDRVWRPEPTNPLITPDLLRVFAHSGSYVVGVHRDGRMVGACLGFLAATGLHSHIAGVESGLRSRNVGFAVKLHQRAWALARGITTVTWTYDPLISRNAYFNLTKLGALPDEYLTDFYGPMNDELNAGAETDRLLVRWDLAGERAIHATAGLRPAAAHLAATHLDTPGAVVALDAKPDGLPVVGRCDGSPALVRIPPDIEELRRSDPATARAWRHALREVLGGLMAEGRAVTEFTRDGWYVIDRPQVDHPPLDHPTLDRNQESQP
ncbi:GNAT family N-acetyltransferase [Streptacidiphilus jiangxiensis]|uniref:Predicted acetyltransferase, GNAT superfamily n=1 Tax=Streptacidiphilus jiangxiensis TaxID=235985 RepID=A0A1H7X9W5_STRJI|nr:GNAT family N-acetyltransferase [Streptacidiphilus jiangxiensis]SEM29938.1 Predicted acetyltransferase, GNAT superfamily [Streptacidiphilus jiangxiensis]